MLKIDLGLIEEMGAVVPVETILALSVEEEVIGK
jgi:hypothetical protein